jgi:hypothetical protein
MWNFKSRDNVSQPPTTRNDMNQEMLATHCSGKSATLHPAKVWLERWYSSTGKLCTLKRGLCSSLRDWWSLHLKDSYVGWNAEYRLVYDRTAIRPCRALIEQTVMLLNTVHWLLQQSYGEPFAIYSRISHIENTSFWCAFTNSTF